MSNQEGQFMPPDSRNINNDRQKEDQFIPRPVNDDPREWQQQQQWQEAPPQQQQMYGEKIQPQQRRRGGPRGCIVALVIVLLILGLSGAGIGLGIAGLGNGFPNFGGAKVSESQSFNVGTSPHLVINDPVGTINVHTGTSNQVTVQATKQGGFLRGNPNNIHISYKESSDQNTISINVDEGSSVFGFNFVDLNITVPDTTDLNLHSNTGSIDVSGVSGQMSLMSNTGAITATQDSLTDSSILKTNTGSVTFDGKIASTGNYDFETDTGSVNVTLPGNTSFHVSAATDTGSINSNFPGVNPQQHGIGNSVNADVGSSPNATLTLKTNTGSIDLNAR